MNPAIENPDTFISDPVKGLQQDALAMVEKCIRPDF